MKILFFDIETSPSVAYAWEKYETTIPQFIREWHILSFSFKWLGGKTKCYSLPDFKLYKRDRHNDKELAKKLHQLMTEADVVVAHNGDQFDIKRANARFLFHKLSPVHPKSIDTLKILRRNFSFNSNHLNDVCQYLGLGKKVEHEGFQLWVKCLDGNKKAWKRMVKYNKQDVVLLHKLYLYLLPWIQGHPNRNVYDETRDKCPKCGGRIQKRGFSRKISGLYQKYQCQSCGGWATDKKMTRKFDVKVV